MIYASIVHHTIISIKTFNMRHNSLIITPNHDSLHRKMKTIQKINSSQFLHLTLTIFKTFFFFYFRKCIKSIIRHYSYWLMYFKPVDESFDELEKPMFCSFKRKTKTSLQNPTIISLVIFTDWCILKQQTSH